MKVKAKQILERAEKRARKFPLSSLPAYHQRRIAHSSKFWDRIEIARSFCIELSCCKESDPKAVNAGEYYRREIVALENAWKAWNVMDPLTLRPIEFKRAEVCRRAAGTERMKEFERWMDKGSASWKEEPEGALKTVEKIMRGFRSAAKGERGPLSSKTARATYTRVREKEMCR